MQRNQEQVKKTFVARTYRQVAGYLIDATNAIDHPSFISMSEDTLKAVCKEVANGDLTTQKALANKRFLGYSLLIDPTMKDMAKVSDFYLVDCAIVLYRPL